MVMTDPIADLLTRMRNAQHGRQTECQVKWSKLKEAILNLMKEQKFIQSVEVEGEGKDKVLTITFDSSRPPLETKRVSSPGGRRYVGSAQIRYFLHGASVAIVSTSQGLMTDKDARAKKIGGELICTVS